MRVYLTNMHNNRKDLVADAIISSGRTDIHIDPEPMPVTGSDVYDKCRWQMIGNYFSIYTDAERDCSNFWEEYRRLSESDYWRTYFILTE